MEFDHGAQFRSPTESSEREVFFLAHVGCGRGRDRRHRRSAALAQALTEHEKAAAGLRRSDGSLALLPRRYETAIGRD